ncbi:redoxin domain-containing protein [Parapedobacter deserti]|uniref:Redoxin domain-containing protein n=1 Tax=Parapedobacter deserti TaxID=1912957 RepID=A0ABV7JPM7_9SPHI
MNKFRKLIICTCLALLTAAGALAQKARVKGNIKGLEDTQILVSYMVDGDVPRMDTVFTKKGKFKWEADMPEPQKVYLRFPARFVEFFAEQGTIRISGDADALGELKISGSKTQDEAVAYRNSLKDLADQERPLYQRYGKGSAAEQLEVEEALEDIRRQKRDRVTQYVTAHPGSPFSVSLVAARATMGAYEDVKPLYDLLDASARQTSAGRQLGERLEVLKRSAIGETMLAFTQNDTEGKPVHFSDFKGKHVLVDFWASWCGPCRAENPNVLKAYNTYKDNNFTVIGVSLDDEADRWKKAIEEDGMPWTQVSDLKGFKNEVSAYYGIQGIPSTLLVDPQGKIIAKDLRGEMLQKKLAELFDNQL